MDLGKLGVILRGIHWRLTPRPSHSDFKIIGVATVKINGGIGKWLFLGTYYWKTGTQKCFFIGNTMFSFAIHTALGGAN